MNLEDIKDQLIEQVQSFWDRVQENSTFISLKEQYENLSPPVQKLLIASLVGFAVLFVYSIPYSYLGNSSSYVEEFETKKALTRKLFRVTREASGIPAHSDTPTGPALESRVRSVLQRQNLLETQIQAVRSNPNLKTPLISSKIEQQGVSVQLSQLNLREITQISAAVESIHQNVKMLNFVVKRSKEKDHYYDVGFDLLALQAARSTSPEEKDKKGRKSR